MIERFFVDRIVFRVKGIESEGFLTDPDPLEAEVKRAMIGRARTCRSSPTRTSSTSGDST